MEALDQGMTQDILLLIAQYFAQAIMALGAAPFVSSMTQITKRAGAHLSIPLVENTSSNVIVFAWSVIVWLGAVVADQLGMIDLYKSALPTVGSVIVGVFASQFGANKTFSVASKNNLAFFGWSRTFNPVGWKRGAGLRFGRNPLAANQPG